MSTTLQQIPAGTYVVDAVHSSVGFGVKHLGLSTFRSTFQNYDVKLEDGVLTGSAQVDSIAIDQPDFKGHLLAEEFFNAAVTPLVTFRSKEIRPADDGSVEVEGELTIKGITKPVLARGSYAQGSVPGGGERVALELEAAIDRREYGLGWQSELPNGGLALGWDVALQVHVELVKA